MAIDVYKEWLGIPEQFRPPTHYQLLRLVDFEDDAEKIQSFYKKLNAHVRKYATGQYSIESQDLLNELAKAMLCLTDTVRKREYDESLGREFDTDLEDAATVGEILVRDGKLSRDQLQEVDEFADRRGLSIRDAAVQMKLIDADTGARALAEELGRPFLDLSEVLPDDEVLDQVPRNVVKRHAIIPLFIDDDILLVACRDEPEPELEDEVRLRFGIPMRPVISTPLAVNQAIAKYYAPGIRDEAAATSVKTSGKKKGTEKSTPKKKPKLKSEMSEGEKKEQKSIGIIILCWSFFAGYLIDNFLILPLLEGWSALYLTVFIIPPIAGFFVWDKYFK